VVTDEIAKLPTYMGVGKGWPSPLDFDIFLATFSIKMLFS